MQEDQKGIPSPFFEQEKDMEKFISDRGITREHVERISELLKVDGVVVLAVKLDDSGNSVSVGSLGLSPSEIKSLLEIIIRSLPEHGKS